MRTDITRTATLIGVVTLRAAATAAPPPRAKGAQVVSRTIDESGGGLPGVTVTVRSGAFQRQAGSQADGRFDIAGVAPGVYFRDRDPSYFTEIRDGDAVDRVMNTIRAVLR